MDELKTRIAEVAEEVKVICKNRGLGAMDKVTVVARDETDPAMWLQVSNDPGCSVVFWRKTREDAPPNDSGWVLANIRPAKNGNVQDPDYLALANFDGVEWRTKYGRTPAGYRVIAWCALPTPEEAEFYAANQ
jgi:hypothetical protein